jgi:hypothetical protein
MKKDKKMAQIIWGIIFIFWIVIGTFQITCSIVSKDYTVSLWNYVSCWVMLMIMLSMMLAAMMQS